MGILLNYNCKTNRHIWLVETVRFTYEELDELESDSDSDDDEEDEEESDSEDEDDDNDDDEDDEESLPSELP